MSEWWDALSTANAKRCPGMFGHEIDAWSPMDWAGCMSGEAGETVNKTKKWWLLKSKKVKLADIAEEIADTAIYMNILCLRLGIDITEAIREKFNIKTIEQAEETGLPYKVFLEKSVTGNGLDAGLLVVEEGVS